jgi:anti-anti-sigma factor
MMERPSFNVSRSNGSTVVAVGGEIDSATAPQLDAVLEHIEARAVTVDLTGVTFIDSSGIVTLVRAWDRMRDAGGQLNVSGCRSHVQRVFEITHVDELFRGDSVAG